MDRSTLALLALLVASAPACRRGDGNADAASVFPSVQIPVPLPSTGATTTPPPAVCTQLRACCNGLAAQSGQVAPTVTALCQMMWMNGAIGRMSPGGEDPQFCEAQLMQMQPLITILYRVDGGATGPLPPACRYTPPGIGAMPGLPR